MSKTQRAAIFRQVLKKLNPSKPPNGDKYILDECPFDCKKENKAAIFGPVGGFKCMSDRDKHFKYDDLCRKLRVGLGVAEYASKRLVLPDGEQFLRNQMQVEDVEKDGVRYVVFNYPNGAKRFRCSWDTKPEFEYGHKVAKNTIYGLDRLKHSSAEFVIATEGESKTDVLTLNLWPTIGVPGASCVKKALDPEHEYLRGKKLYVLQDPGDAGEKFVQTIANMCEPGRVLALKLARDPSDIWMEKPDRESFYATVREGILAAKIVKPESASLDDIPPSAETDAKQALYTFESRTVDEIEPKAVDWCWPGFLVWSEVVVEVGQSGCGKTPLVYDIIARITTGRGFPGYENERREPADVILFQSEDNPSMALRPRLEAAGADLKRVHLVTNMFRTEGLKKEEVATRLDQGLAALENLVIKHKARMVAIDPFANYVHGPKGLNAHMRGLVNELQDVARRHQLLIIYVIHVNKNRERDAIGQSTGDGSLISIPRISYLVKYDPRDTNEGSTDRLKLMSEIRNSYRGDTPPGMKFRTVGVDVSIGGKMVSHPRIEWCGTDSRRADDVIEESRQVQGTQKGFAPVKTDSAMGWLQDFLKDGPKLASTSERLEPGSVFGEGKNAGHQWTTVDEAGKRLGVIKSKGKDLGSQYEQSRSYWRLPSANGNGRSGLHVVSKNLEPEYDHDSEIL